jgi:hypothetical protein
MLDLFFHPETGAISEEKALIFFLSFSSVVFVVAVVVKFFDLI